MFTLALIFAGTNKVVGQGAVHGSLAPQDGTLCKDYPLHPKAGESYNYVVSQVAGDPVTSWTWWATKNPNFIDIATGTGAPNLTNMLLSPGSLISVGTDYGVDKGNAGPSMEITWSPEILAATKYQADAAGWATATPAAPTPTFVVAVGNGDCTNNLQVYEINPTASFTVDITNINPADNTAVGYGVDVDQCVDIIRSALYNSGTDKVDMDYGSNTLYFEVIAANFVTSWLPTFQVMEGLAGDQEITEFSWGYDLATLQAGTSVESFAGPFVNSGVIQGTVPLVADATVTNTAIGVSIFVKVVIDNNTYQSLAPSDIKIAVDGVDYTGQYDLVNEDCSDPGKFDQADIAIHTLTPRPTIQDDTTDDKSGNLPDTFIEKVN